MHACQLAVVFTAGMLQFACCMHPGRQTQIGAQGTHQAAGVGLRRLSAQIARNHAHAMQCLPEHPLLSGIMQGAPQIARRATRIPSWLLGAAFFSFSALTYTHVMRHVGTNVNAQLEEEAARQEAAERRAGIRK